MKLASFDALASALHRERVRYLIVGGLAVNAHGYLRFTKDVDLVLRLVSENIERAFAALESLGYRPLVPVSAAQFADAPTRGGWIREKGMVVLQFWSDAHRETPVDMFVNEPFDFEEEYRRSLAKPLGNLEVRFVSAATLIRMKQEADRPQDRIDIGFLKKRLEDDGGS
jgi:hypothetical protein